MMTMLTFYSVIQANFCVDRRYTSNNIEDNENMRGEEKTSYNYGNIAPEKI